MGQGKMSYDQLLALADQLKKNANDMELLLGEVKTLFGRVGTGDVWSGTSAASAKEQFDRLSAKFPEFSEVINVCRDNLIKVVEDYKALDRAVSGMQNGGAPTSTINAFKGNS